MRRSVVLFFFYFVTWTLVLEVHSAGIFTSSNVPSPLLRWSLSSSPSLYCTCAIFASVFFFFAEEAGSAVSKRMRRACGRHRAFRLARSCAKRRQVKAGRNAIPEGCFTGVVDGVGSRGTKCEKDWELHQTQPPSLLAPPLRVGIVARFCEGSLFILCLTHRRLCLWCPGSEPCAQDCGHEGCGALEPRHHPYCSCPASVGRRRGVTAFEVSHRPRMFQS